MRECCFSFQLLLNFTIEFYETLGGWRFLGRPTEVQLDCQVLAFMVQAAYCQSIVLEVLFWVVDGVIGKLCHSVRRVHFVEDKLLVLLVFDLNSE